MGEREVLARFAQVDGFANQLVTRPDSHALHQGRANLVHPHRLDRLFAGVRHIDKGFGKIISWPELPDLAAIGVGRGLLDTKPPG